MILYLSLSLQFDASPIRLVAIQGSSSPKLLAALLIHIPSFRCISNSVRHKFALLCVDALRRVSPLLLSYALLLHFTAIQGLAFPSQLLARHVHRFSALCLSLATCRLAIPSQSVSPLLYSLPRQCCAIPSLLPALPGASTSPPFKAWPFHSLSVPIIAIPSPFISVHFHFPAAIISFPYLLSASPCCSVSTRWVACPKLRYAQPSLLCTVSAFPYHRLAPPLRLGSFRRESIPFQF